MKVSKSVHISEVMPSVKCIIREIMSITECGIGITKTELLAQMERSFEGTHTREHFSNIDRNVLFAIATLVTRLVNLAKE